MTKKDLLPIIHKALIGATEQVGFELDPSDKIGLMMTLDLQFTDKMLVDMHSFINYCRIKNMTANFMAANLLHDIMGVSNEESCFLPRTHGYADSFGQFCYRCNGKVTEADGYIGCEVCGEDNGIH